jgi:hypothetical protein
MRFLHRSPVMFYVFLLLAIVVFGGFGPASCC